MHCCVKTFFVFLLNGELCEIKSQRDMIKFADELTPKFAAAEEFSRDQEYRFRTVTSLEMSAERVANANDLYQDLLRPREEQFENSVRFLIKNVCGGNATGHQIFEKFGHHDDFIVKFRLLIALGLLTTDWDKIISLDSVFEWGPGELAWDRSL